MVKKISATPADRVKIMEKALLELADSLKKRDRETREEIRDIIADLKAIKLFLTRNNPVFKEQFPEIRKKIK